MSAARPLVLIVDPSPADLSLLFKALEPEGLEVVAADSAVRALGLMNHIQPDMVLLEASLPDMDGFTLCRRIKKDPRLAGAPVVFTTRLAGTADLIKGFEAGAADYVAKPFHRREIRARVKTHLDMYAALRELERLKEAALDLNPLTCLPGNNSIGLALQKYADLDEDVCVIYADLDNFKPYNDHYGFAQGDQVILFAAAVLGRVASRLSPQNSFLGHIGGDDFVLVVAADMAAEVGHEIGVSFKNGIADFYTWNDRIKGHIEARDRRGFTQRYPLVSISMGGVFIKGQGFTNYLEIASLASEVKRRAKSMPGSNLYLNQRKYAAGEAINF